MEPQRIKYDDIQPGDLIAFVSGGDCWYGTMKVTETEEPSRHWDHYVLLYRPQPSMTDEEYTEHLGTTAHLPSDRGAVLNAISQPVFEIEAEYRGDKPGLLEWMRTFTDGYRTQYLAGSGKWQPVPFGATRLTEATLYRVVAAPAEPPFGPGWEGPGSPELDTWLEFNQGDVWMRSRPSHAYEWGEWAKATIFDTYRFPEWIIQLAAHPPRPDVESFIRSDGVTVPWLRKDTYGLPGVSCVFTADDARKLATMCSQGAERMEWDELYGDCQEGCCT